MNACQLGAEAFTTEPKCEDAPPPSPDSAPAPVAASVVLPFNGGKVGGKAVTVPPRTLDAS